MPTEAHVRTLSWEPGPPVEEFPEILAEHGFSVPQREFKPDGWRLESPLKLRLMERLRPVGKTLREHVGARVARGLTTGLNEAFVVDESIRKRLITEHRSSEQLLKPFLRGRDVKRWKCALPEQYLIKIESSENAQHPWSGKPHAEAERTFAKTYPAIHAWLCEPTRRKALIDRYDQGKYFWEMRACT